jgi:regulator of protease activity HflC (stomatin/prohibitin superfamily)
MNRRLQSLALGVEISRVDLTASLPGRAKPAFDQVLAAEAEAARVIASARTDAEKYRQQGERDRTEIQQTAEAKAKELIAKARVATDRITSLAAESSPQRRALLLTRLYRERMEAIVRRAGVVTLVDGNEPIRLLLPGGTEKK